MAVTLEILQKAGANLAGTHLFIVPNSGRLDRSWASSATTVILRRLVKGAVELW